MQRKQTNKIANIFKRKNTQPFPIPLSDDNYVILRMWKPKLDGKETFYTKAILGEVRGKNAAVGHISMEIFNGNEEPTYLSHWPDFDVRAQRLSDSQNTHNQDSDKRDVGKNNTLEYDLKNEDGLPDEYIILYGLNIDAMLKKVFELGEQCRWTIKGRKSDKISSLFNKQSEQASSSYSCSSYIYELLKAGNIFYRLLPDSHQLKDPITPIDVANLGKKAKAAENNLYPLTKSFLNKLTKVKEKILNSSNEPMDLAAIDYATCYYKHNPNDATLLNKVCSNLAESYSSSLLEKVKNYSAANKYLKQKSDDEIIKLIDKCGANPLTQDKTGYNALYYAIINRSYNGLKAILNKYPALADSAIETPPNVKKEENLTASDLLLFSPDEKTKKLSKPTKLIDLATELGYDEIKSLLIKFGAKASDENSYKPSNEYSRKL